MDNPSYRVDDDQATNRYLQTGSIALNKGEHRFFLRGGGGWHITSLRGLREWGGGKLSLYTPLCPPVLLAVQKNWDKIRMAAS